jgi:uncharacterized protein YndB with AHSA1/START domain
MINRSTTETGSLVIADISGYTAFVTGTELEHSREILIELMSAVTDSFKGRIRVEQLEGDAILATSTTGAELVDYLEDAFIAFHRRLRDITAVTTCPCQACVNVRVLTLKFIAHGGSYSRQQVGGGTQLYGGDVIVVHRLLKNTVPSHEYILATKPLLDSWPRELASLFDLLPQEYGDVGVIDAGYHQLDDLRERAWQYERTRVSADEARLKTTAEFDAPIDEMWRVLTDPAHRTKWMHAERVDYEGGARGSMLGAQYHCHHGAGAPTVFTVLAVEEPGSMTQVCAMPTGSELYGTFTLTPLGPRRSRLESYMYWDAQPGMKGRLQSIGTKLFMSRISKQQVEGMRKVLAEMPARGLGVEASLPRS